MTSEGYAPSVKPEPRKPAAPFAAVLRPMRGLFAMIRPAEQPLELQLAGRTLLHAALVGLAAGILGCLFFAGAELLQRVALEELAGYHPLRAVGESVFDTTASHGSLRPWLLVLIPAAGALVGGLITRYAPETAGGGGDAAIEAFHHHNGVLRRRVLWAKPLASIATLGSGGSGGREGPTMQIGAALGSTVGRYLAVAARERRVLMVAGVAAGISAVFRAPLGAALIAIEMLYRDDFESEALIPAVLASVIAYSVSISVFGNATLFGHLQPFPFHPSQIPLFILLALVVSAGASLFVAALRVARRVAQRLPGPVWFRPCLGGLALGVLATAIIEILGPVLGHPHSGLGVLGGGYGAAQVSITGADWLPSGWTGVQILVGLALAKIVASSFTIGTGGSAGDFAPALATGALLGGAFGLAARIVLDDPSIQPGAFALVGMGTFYGGIANTPLASLVLVCEMAGSYDLLVPLMLAGGVAFIALRRVTLYPAQVATLRQSPAHRAELDPLAQLRCGAMLRTQRSCTVVAPQLRVVELLQIVESAPDQDVFPVVDASGVLCGLVAAEALRVLAAEPAAAEHRIVADLMHAAISVTADQELRIAAQRLLEHDLRALPVLDANGAILGLLDEHDLAAAFLGPPPSASGRWPVVG